MRTVAFTVCFYTNPNPSDLKRTSTRIPHYFKGAPSFFFRPSRDVHFRNTPPQVLRCSACSSGAVPPRRTRACSEQRESGMPGDSSARAWVGTHLLSSRNLNKLLKCIMIIDQHHICLFLKSVIAFSYGCVPDAILAPSETNYARCERNVEWAA